MKKTAGMLWAAVSAFAFAAPSVDKDGVPVVDIHGTIIQITDANTLAAAKNSRFRPIQRRRMIAVGDKQIPLGEFLRTYCYGKMQNETCARGISISRIDSTFGLTESLPKGL